MQKVSANLLCYSLEGTAVVRRKKEKRKFLTLFLVDRIVNTTWYETTSGVLLNRIKVEIKTIIDSI